MRRGFIFFLAPLQVKHVEVNVDSYMKFMTLPDFGEITYILAVDWFCLCVFQQLSAWSEKKPSKIK